MSQFLIIAYSHESCGWVSMLPDFVGVTGRGNAMELAMWRASKAAQQVCEVLARLDQPLPTPTDLASTKNAPMGQRLWGRLVDRRRTFYSAERHIPDCVAQPRRASGAQTGTRSRKAKVQEQREHPEFPRPDRCEVRREAQHFPCRCIPQVRMRQVISASRIQGPPQPAARRHRPSESGCQDAAPTGSTGCGNFMGAAPAVAMRTSTGARPIVGTVDSSILTSTTQMSALSQSMPRSAAQAECDRIAS